MIYGVLAYLMWGLFPAYFPLLLPASPLEILAHRVVWTAVIMVIVLSFSRGGWRELREASRGTWIRMGTAGAVVSINWLIYVMAVNSTHVADAALGYFMNPLVSVVLGMLFLGERLRGLQLTSVGIATVAVLLLTFLAGHPPLIGLALAFSFGFYGLIKKQVAVSATASLTAETLIISPVALAYLGYLTYTGESTFLSEGASHSVLLISSGLVTALPLLFFGKGAKLLPLATIGMLQYMTPSIQMLWALFVNHEHVEPARWVGFVIIWTAVLVFLFDLYLQRRGEKRRRRRDTGAVAEEPSPPPPATH